LLHAYRWCCCALKELVISGWRRREERGENREERGEREENREKREGREERGLLLPMGVLVLVLLYIFFLVLC
jgi:hypothetical protein